MPVYRTASQYESLGDVTGIDGIPKSQYQVSDATQKMSGHQTDGQYCRCYWAIVRDIVVLFQ
jgi:hypothetical protein